METESTPLKTYEARVAVVGTPLMSGLILHKEPKTQQSDNGVQFQILGDEAQCVEVMLQPGQIMRMEPGKMVHMHESLMPEIGTDGGCGQACTRCCCAGGSMFRLMYENKSSEPIPMAASPSWPAKAAVLPLDMSRYNGIHLSASAWFASVATKTEFSIQRAQSAGAACCGGQGLFYNVMTGDGVAFLCGGGAIVEKELAAGEAIVIDTSSLLAWEPSVQLEVRRAGGCLMCCCGGEGLFLNEMKGPGKIWIQPMPLSKLKANFVSPGGGGGGGGDGGGGGGGGA